MATPDRAAGRAQTVRDVMQFHVVTVPPRATVRELIQILSEEGISGAPVLDPHGKILGVVSATDVIRLAAHEAEIPAGQLSWEPALLPEEQDEDDGASYFALPETPVRFTAPVPGAAAETAFDRYRVEDIMTPVAFSVAPDASLQEVVQLFVRGRIHRVLVVDRGMLLGIATPFDVLGALFDLVPEPAPPRT